MRILVFLLVGTTLSGCSGLMMSGGGSGASPAEKDRVESSQQASDETITGRVMRRLTADPALSESDIGVRTSGGKVFLSGSADSYAARESAEKLTMKMDGVKAVDNQIRVILKK